MSALDVFNKTIQKGDTLSIAMQISDLNDVVHIFVYVDDIVYLTDHSRNLVLYQYHYDNGYDLNTVTKNYPYSYPHQIGNYEVKTGLNRNIMIVSRKPKKNGI